MNLCGEGTVVDNLPQDRIVNFYNHLDFYCFLCLRWYGGVCHVWFSAGVLHA